MHTSSVATSYNKRYAVFDLLVSFSQLCGFAFVVLSGFLFNTMDHGIGWPQKGNDRGLNFHGILMSTGLVFFQGEALLSYRMYRSDSKILSKTIHFVFHLLAISFFTTAFAAIIIQKNVNGWSNFTSVHSWIGLGLMFVYTIQFLFGFINFVIPGISDDVRRKFLPIHKIVGSFSFAASIVQATIGYIQYNSLFKCPDSHDAPLVCDKFQFIFNFTIVAEVLYGASVLILVLVPNWKRYKTQDEMK
uniref:Cytochrome b561 domain-containing protein n=1 Tax=Haemonchus contortus TaxID=6289 RepID=A0A7I4YTP4_HAECO|nr:Cytochrome b561 domain containing protein [Haemonchus contortus]